MKQYIYNHLSQPLNIYTIGAATCRFNSLLYINNKIFVPVATSLAIYEDINLNKICQFQTNQSTIYSLAHNDRYIYCIGFGGDICQLDIRTYEKLNYINHHFGSQCRWSTIEGNRLSISIEHSQNKGIVQVFDCETLQPLKSFDGCYFYGCIINNFCYVLKAERIGKLSHSDKAKLNNFELKKYRNNKQYKFVLEIYEENLIEKHELPTKEGDILLVAKSHKYIAYFYYDRRIIVYDIDNHQFIKPFIIEGNGVIQATCFQNEHELVFQNKRKEITIINLKTLEIKVTQYKLTLDVVVQCILKNDEVLITASEEFLSFHKEGRMVHKPFGGLTKCGLDFYQNDYVVSGDFLGNMTINDINSGIELTQYMIGVSIRSIVCKGSVIYIGTMDGMIYKWCDQEIQQFDTLNGSVTCLRVKNQDLLASTTDGIIKLYRNEKEICSFLAHPPKPKSELFGSLDIHADIWTCIFNPEKDLFATGSEDQTVKVFDYEKNQIVELIGHKLAVTCLDWQRSQGELILYSCSDDRTVRLYNEQYQLLKVIDTFFIKEWFTLTYMMVCENLIALGAQNGYFFLYDLHKNDFLVVQKIHMGGIEGLVMNSKMIATCSSDDCINVIKL